MENFTSAAGITHETGLREDTYKLYTHNGVIILYTGVLLLFIDTIRWTPLLPVRTIHNKRETVPRLQTAVPQTLHASGVPC